jgi:carbonic anhydrase
MTRAEARQKILKEANRDRPDHLDPFTENQIQQAVHKVRNLNLVSASVLLTAGFQVHGPNYRVRPRKVEQWDK